ncbi:hypothetical protein LAZ67_X002590, partial [Cordylochernes scorpioides]
MNEIPIAKFDGDNFPSWKYRVESILESKDLISFLIEDTPGEESERQKWKIKDSQAKGIITCAMTDSQVSLILTCKTSKQIWASLTKIFEGDIKKKSIEARNNVSRLRMYPEESWKDYLQRSEKLLENARIMGATIDDEEFIYSRMPGHRKRRQFKQTDAFTRGMVIGLKRAGWSIRQIAADTHLGASTVHRLWRRWLEQGNLAIYRNAGATRVTSARVDRRILRQAVAAPQATCTAILQHVQDTLDHSISTRTISRRLVANGLHSCRPLRRLPLTPPNRRQRLEWCRARSTWMTEWHRVVFSDESRFCLSSDSRRVRVWRRRGERSNPAAIVERPTVRQRGIMPRSEDELWQMVEREWRAIPQDAIRTLIDSLPRRVAACIAVRVYKPECYICNKREHKANDCWHNPKYKGDNNRREDLNKPSTSGYKPKFGNQQKQTGNSHNEKAANCLIAKNQEKSEQEWIIDSGATSHMTSCFEILKDSENKEKKIILADDTQIESKAIGNVKIKTKEENLVILKDVLFVPQIKGNLLSVGKLVQDYQRIIFSKDKCTIIDFKDQVILEAPKIDDFYIINSSGSRDEEDKVFKVNWDIWHKRLGYPNENYMTIMKNKNLVYKFDCISKGDLNDCITCIKSKYSRKPFKRIEKIQTSQSLELLHIYLIGPIKEESIATFTPEFLFGALPSGRRSQSPFLDWPALPPISPRELPVPANLPSSSASSLSQPDPRPNSAALPCTNPWPNSAATSQPTSAATPPVFRTLSRSPTADRLFPAATHPPITSPARFPSPTSPWPTYPLEYPPTSPTPMRFPTLGRGKPDTRCGSSKRLLRPPPASLMRPHKHPSLPSLHGKGGAGRLHPSHYLQEVLLPDNLPLPPSQGAPQPSSSRDSPSPARPATRQEFSRARLGPAPTLAPSRPKPPRPTSHLPPLPAHAVILGDPGTDPEAILEAVQATQPNLPPNVWASLGTRGKLVLHASSPEVLHDLFASLSSKLGPSLQIRNPNDHLPRICNFRVADGPPDSTLVDAILFIPAIAALPGPRTVRLALRSSFRLGTFTAFLEVDPDTFRTLGPRDRLGVNPIIHHFEAYLRVRVCSRCCGFGHSAVRCP